MRKTVSILGTSVDRLNMRESVERIEQFIQDGGFHQVATANTDFIVNALSDDELHQILTSADLVTADGMPVVWSARMLRSSIPERVTGADLVPEIAAMAAARGFKIYLLGAREDVALRAAFNLQKKHPGLIIVGSASPHAINMDDPNDPESAKILDDIRSVRPDILLVAFGNPKQEKWIYRNRAELQSVAVCIGVGATLDFLAGEARRAPKWMQRNGLEWLHRLSQDPLRLWRRYNRDFWVFGWRLLLAAIDIRRARPNGSLGRGPLQA